MIGWQLTSFLREATPVIMWLSLPIYSRIRMPRNGCARFLELACVREISVTSVLI